MATLVARPDAHPETSTFDADLWYEGVGDITWATMRGAAAATTIADANQTAVIYLLNGVAAGTWNSLGRVILGFNTAAIGASSTITAAELQITPRSTPFDDLTQSANLSTVTAPASATSVTDSDYNVTKYGSTKLSTDVALATLVADTPHTFTLNADGRSAISKTGITWLALRIVSDITNSEPGVNPGGNLQSDLSIRSAEDATEANRPVLTVTYTLPGASAPGCISISIPAIMRRRGGF